MAGQYVLQAADLVTKNPIYVREVSWIGVHCTYKAAEAKRMDAKEARALKKQLGGRYSVVPAL